MAGKFGAKYVYSPKHIIDILSKIQETGRPDKLTNSYVQKTWLIKDAQYSAVLDLLKDMSFLEENGTPKGFYAEYQNPSISKITLAKGIRCAYPEFFKAYPNANNLPKDTITGYYKQITGTEGRTLERIVSTFTTLCGLADFSNENQPPNIENNSPQNQYSQNQQNNSSTLLPITMNIQIVIPSDATSEQYDKIFSSIKKFLIK